METKVGKKNTKSDVFITIPACTEREQFTE